MAKKKEKFICEYADWCGKEFKTSRGLSVHKSRRSHWGKYQPTPVEVHTNYFDLIKGSHRSWGQKMTKEQAKSPNIEKLQLGATFVVIDLLEKIAKHLGVKE